MRSVIAILALWFVLVFVGERMVPSLRGSALWQLVTLPATAFLWFWLRDVRSKWATGSLEIGGGGRCDEGATHAASIGKASGRNPAGGRASSS